MPSNPPHLHILTSSKPHEFFNSLENRDLTPGSEAAQLSATLFSQKDPGLCLQVGRGTLYGCGGGRHGPLGTAGGSSGIQPTQIRPSLRTRCWPGSLAAQLEDSSHLSCPVPGFPPNPTSPHSWAWCLHPWQTAVSCPAWMSSLEATEPGLSLKPLEMASWAER